MKTPMHGLADELRADLEHLEHLQHIIANRDTALAAMTGLAAHRGERIEEMRQDLTELRAELHEWRNVHDCRTLARGFDAAGEDRILPATVEQ